jgi:hypothetical protein
MTQLSESEAHASWNFDTAEVMTLLSDSQAGIYMTLRQGLTSDQLTRLEACEFFFPNVPERKRGHVTGLSLKDIRRKIMELTKTYPALRSADLEKMTLKIERANQSLRERFNQ